MNFDILMPIILFIVTVVAISLGKKAEGKLKVTVEQREFKNRDVALLVAMIVVAISVVAFVPDMAIMAVFLFSYSSLLFTITYAFSDMKPKWLALFCGAFIVVSDLCIASMGVLPAELRIPGTLAFTLLTACSFIAWMYARHNTGKQKWYLAVLSPTLFLLLFFFYRGTGIWFPYLLDVYGLLFALLIVLYLGSLFTWKTVFIFAAFLTAMDIVLVWVTGQMVQAANAVSGMGLPVLVAFPTIPPMFRDGGILIMRLGLGDFFFAGILATQTMKKFGKKISIATILTMCISFGLFELVLLNPELADVLPVHALPATLPIVLGWLPIVAWKILVQRKTRKLETTITVASQTPVTES